MMCQMCAMGMHQRCALGKCTCLNRVSDRTEKAMMESRTAPTVEDIYQQLMHVSTVATIFWPQMGPENMRRLVGEVIFLATQKGIK